MCVCVKRLIFPPTPRSVKDVNTGVGKLLKYIGSLKGLAAIRDAVWDLIKEVCIDINTCVFLTSR